MERPHEVEREETIMNARTRQRYIFIAAEFAAGSLVVKN